MKVFSLVAVFLFTATLCAQEVVYTGTPMVRLSGEPGAFSEELLSAREADEYKMEISRQEGRYFWKSRENRELRVSRSGVYVTLSCESGFIKLVDPMWNEARGLYRDQPGERFDYVEVMHTQLGLVVYWGRGRGSPFGSDL